MTTLFLKAALILTAALMMTFSAGFPQIPPGTQAPSHMERFVDETRVAFDARMQWWRDARFGLFIHWGAYAVLSGQYKGEESSGTAEWIMNSASIPVAEYEEYARRFNPVEFDAEEWVRIARDAGMKYIVITSKHHEGFSMWNSNVTEYDVVDATPFGRDVLGELSDAAHKAGIPLGFYYSIMDWHHPDAQAQHYPTYNTSEKSSPKFERYLETYLKPQIRELVERYDPAILWFDGEWIPEYTHEMGLEMYEFVRGLKPDILINNRVDVGRKGMQGMNREDGEFAGDFGTPEQEILEGTSSFDWESCMTMNDTWGHRATDHNWKSSRTLIHNLVDIVAKGGNYLLNVGPDAQGVIPRESVERLRAMGDWLDVNGEAIYGSHPWTTVSEGENIRYTQVGSSHVYAISLEWPGSRLVLQAVQPAPGSEIHMLGDGGPLHWTYDAESGLVIDISERLQYPANRPSRHAHVFKIEL